jgi:hypothetical protein
MNRSHEPALSTIFASRNPSQRRTTHDLAGDQPADYTDWQERPPYRTEADIISLLTYETNGLELHHWQQVLDGIRPLS